ncbi:MAG: hypothetical protein ACJA1Q_002562 [Pseudohongiellaceae bacterium]
MNFQDLGNIGELIAAICMVATLGYLAVQIRNSTNSTRVATLLTVNDSLTAINSALRSDGEFSDIWLRGLRDLESLSEVERVRFTAHALEVINLSEYINLLEQQNLAYAHIDYIPWVRALYRDNPGFRDFLRSLKGEWAGSKELYDRITSESLAKGTAAIEISNQ